MRIKPDERHPVRLTVNGRPLTGLAAARTLLSDFLRHALHLYGTHVGCEHGICGACTVEIDGRLARSCLTLAVQADGAELTTVEGLAGPAGLSPLQQAFARHGALQCGFCTPGILISASHFLAHNPDPSEAEVRDMLSGHICRCTGYEGIVRAILDCAEAKPEP